MRATLEIRGEESARRKGRGGFTGGFTLADTFDANFATRPVRYRASGVNAPCVVLYFFIARRRFRKAAVTRIDVSSRRRVSLA